MENRERRPSGLSVGSKVAEGVRRESTPSGSGGSLLSPTAANGTDMRRPSAASSVSIDIQKPTPPRTPSKSTKSQPELNSRTPSDMPPTPQQQHKSSGRRSASQKHQNHHIHNRKHRESVDSVTSPTDASTRSPNARASVPSRSQSGRSYVQTTRSPSTRNHLEYDPDEYVEEEEEIASDEEVPLDTTHLSLPTPSPNFERAQNARHSSRRRRWLRGAGPISLSIDLPTPEERPDELEMYEEQDEEMPDEEVREMKEMENKKNGKNTNERREEKRERRVADRDSDRERLGERPQCEREPELKMDVQEEGQLVERSDSDARVSETEEHGFREVFISLNGPGVGLNGVQSTNNQNNQNNNNQRAPQLNGANDREIYISTDSREVPRARQQERYNQLLAHFTTNGSAEEYLQEDVPLQQLHGTRNGIAANGYSPSTPPHLQNSSPASARYTSQSTEQQMKPQQQQTPSPEVLRNRFYQRAQTSMPPEPAKKRHTTQSPRSRRMIECVLTQNDEDDAEDGAEVPVTSPPSGRSYRHLEAALSHITKPLLATHKEVSLVSVTFNVNC